MDGIFELLQFSKASQEEQYSLSLEDSMYRLSKSFLDSLNDDAIYEKESYGGEIKRGFHPSSICGAVCARKLCYEYLDTPKDVEDRIGHELRRIFDNGSSVHDRWQNYLTLMSLKYPDKIELIGDWRCKGCGIKYSPKKEVSFPIKGDKPYPECLGDIEPCTICGSTRWKYNEFRLSNDDLLIVGKRDGKIKLVEEDKTLLVEIKSIRSYMFNRLVYPYDKHKKQFSFYMFLDGTHEGLFLYENKDDQKIKILYHEYNEADIAEELKLVEVAAQNVKAGTIANRIRTFPHSKHCKGCPWLSTCSK